MKINKPHDKFVKETLGNIEVAQSFLANYLPEKISSIIDIATLTPVKDSYINENLAEGFSDLLFKARMDGLEGYFYFLFEHKSYDSNYLVIKLLDYMVSIWQSKIKKENAKELPVIFPLVIYHNAARFKSKTALGDMIAGYSRFTVEIRKLIPDYQFLLFDLSEYDNDELKGLAQLRILFLLLRDVPIKEGENLWDTIERAMEYLSEIADEQTEQEFFMTMMIYLFSASRTLSKKDFNEIKKRIEHTYPERSKELMSLADILREEGMEKGIEKGIKEKSVEVVRNLLNEGFDVDRIAKLTGLTRLEVEKIIGELKN